MSLVDDIAQVFLAHPDEWLDYRTLGRVGGFGGWRTRISDARRQYHMHIDNRWRTATDGTRRWRVSEYCYRPAVSAVRIPDSSCDHAPGEVLLRDVCAARVDGAVSGPTS